MTILLEGQKVCKNFGGLAALERVDFHIHEGEILGLPGPNGAGKTTLFRCITGVYPPSTGKILFDGKEISRLMPHDSCVLGITSTPQVVKPFPEMTVLDNVRVGAFFGKGWVRGEVKDATQEPCEFLSSPAWLPKPIFWHAILPLPDRKRLEVARALATRPKLLLLDEVVAGLNPTETDMMIHLIRQLQEGGITIFMVEHVMRAVLGVSDRLIVLNFGEKIAERTPDHVATHPQVVEAYLGKNYAHGENVG